MRYVVSVSLVFEVDVEAPDEATARADGIKEAELLALHNDPADRVVVRVVPKEEP